MKKYIKKYQLYETFDKKKVEDKLKEYDILEYNITEEKEYKMLLVTVPSKFKKEFNSFSKNFGFDITPTKDKKYYYIII